MQQIVDELCELGQGQEVRLVLDDGEEVEVRVNQISHAPDDYLRLELSGGEERYQARSRSEEGEWIPVELRRRDRSDWSLETLGQVSEVIPGGTFRTVKSADMEAQEDTGTRR